MIYEYHQSIMKNDVWDIVSRPEEKSVVTSKSIFKIKHVADGSIEKHKAKFVARVSLKKRELIMLRRLLQFPSTLLSSPLFLLLLSWVGNYIKWM